ncbi:MAG: phosphoribosylaminoimidazolesuccinocarboxamide synthase [Spirochaetia bacterium]|nr:phosphoribosylaminoimidazolesuccinocarboxamide synthase [Spirochaetia bacterium]
MNPRTPDPFYKGKVRDLYPVSDTSMIIVASDRISAFDVVFPDIVPDKGKILNRVSLLWFEALRKSGFEQKHGLRDHILESEISKFPDPFTNYEPFEGRSILVQKTNRIDFECVVRGYLAGSGYKEYLKTGEICGHKLPKGLKNSDRLPEPIFTPATKAPDGEHDENVSIDYMRSRIGDTLTEKLEKLSIEIFQFASELLEPEGIILCDTKFEFGLDDDGAIVLIDEILTPDSSRYWNQAYYKPGENQTGYDKQFIRDYVESLGWDKKPPAPSLPEDVIQKTIQLYGEIQEKIQKALHF